jgi:hypothetical protein
MMGRRERRQGQFFYAFDLDKVVPIDHLVRQIDGVLDLDWVHKELAPYYSQTGRPSIDCVFRRSRPVIPSEGGHLYRLKPAGDSDDPCHLPRRALVSTLSSGQLVGWSSSL